MSQLNTKCSNTKCSNTKCLNTKCSNTKCSNTKCLNKNSDLKYILFSDYYNNPLYFCSNLCRNNFVNLIPIIKCGKCLNVINKNDFSINSNSTYFCSLKCKRNFN